MRLAELSQLCAGMLAPDDLAEIVAELRRVDYLADGRPGEWRAGERLNDLFDQQERPHCPLSIYSNIQGAAGRMIDIRHEHTGQIVARVDAHWLDRSLLTLEGRPVEVEWADGEAMWVRPYGGREEAERLDYRAERQLLSYELARALPERLGLPAGTAPFIPAPRGRMQGWWWFHLLGDLYGRAVCDLLRYRIAVRESTQPGLCLWMPDEPRALPHWTPAQVETYLQDTYRAWEPLLPLGPYHSLLPTRLRRRAVVEGFDVPRFLEAAVALRSALAPEQLSGELADLLHS